MLERGPPCHGTTAGFPSLIAPSPSVSSPSSPDARAAEAMPSPQAADPGPTSFALGERVLLAQRPPYLKSADPMPMLRPPDLIDEGESGVVVEQRALGQCAVRFRRGTFLLGARQLRRDPSAQEP